MEETVNHFHTPSSSVCCGSVLLKVQTVRANCKCCHLWKQELLQDRYVTLNSNCNGSAGSLCKAEQ